MKRFVMLFVLFVIMINTAYADEFKLIYSSVPDGASCVPADSDFFLNTVTESTLLI